MSYKVKKGVPAHRFGEIIKADDVRRAEIAEEIQNPDHIECKNA